MTSFEDLPLGPELVEALAADGIEVPTPFQSAAIPVIARGNDLMGRAGPGAGTLIAYAAPLVDRLEGGAGSPVCLILCTGHRQATDLARSLARLCEAGGLRAAALTDHWNLPERADFLCVPADRLRALNDGSISLERVGAVVFHDGDGVLGSVPTDHLEAFLSSLPSECQRVVCGHPFGPEVTSLAQRFTRRAATVPPRAAAGTAEARKRTDRGTLNLMTVEGDPQEAALALAATLLEEPVMHLLVYAASADQAADLADFLGIHGYASGAPGDSSAPVWLSPGEDEAARQALNESSDPGAIATLSFAVPVSSDATTLRHGAGGPAWVMARIRELGHLKEVAAEAGLRLVRARPPRPGRVTTRLDELTAELGKLVVAPEMGPYYLLVESLLDRFSAGEVAAAALYMLDREGSARKKPQRPSDAPKSWVRLFVSAGERDEVGPRELLGALTSQSGIPGKRVGRIDVRESHSLVEVEEEDARAIIDALNGTTLGGRSLRVDYDRGKDRRPGPGKGPRKPAVGRRGER